MRRIIILTALVALAQGVASLSPALPQSPGTATAIRRIQVKAQTIAALRTGKKYVVDLTQRGVKYEFDPKTGQIDFSRVVVHYRAARYDDGFLSGTHDSQGRYGVV